MKQLNLLSFCILFIGASCTKEPLNPEPELIDFRAVQIRWTGDYSIDGCGYFVIIDSIQYKPFNEEFLYDSFHVMKDTVAEMKYLDLKREIVAQCGEGFPFKVLGIEIMDIK